MYKDKQILAIIPARGGSRGIPRKNIKDLAGKPLIAYTIEEAKKSGYLDRIVVSTDDEEIGEVAKRYGGEVPFLRPKELAGDETPDLPVFLHALKWLKENRDYVPDLVVHLRPTSPLREAEHVDEAIELLEGDKSADSVRGVCTPTQNPFKMWQIKEGYMEPLVGSKKFKEPYNTPRQLLPVVYWQNGHIEVIRYETIMKKHSMTGDKILPYIMDQEYSVDIDSNLSIKLAEVILNEKR